MTPLIPALSGMMIVGGVLGVVHGARRTPVEPARPRRVRPVRARLDRRTVVLLAVGSAAGLVVALLTGWVVAAIALPAAAVGIPMLLTDQGGARRIRRLEAMEEWTRSLAGILVAGLGLDQALIATMRSTPEAIRPEVGRLTARLRARWGTEDALRAFADDLDDATGDLIAANLILGARRRGPGLAAVLESLAESVAADVRGRRQIEADREKPRTVARWVTLATVVTLVLLGLFGSSYVAPYGSVIGQLILTLLLGAYGGALAMMKRMAAGKPLPRFIGDEARKEASR